MPQPGVDAGEGLAGAATSPTQSAVRVHATVEDLSPEDEQRFDAACAREARAAAAQEGDDEHKRVHRAPPELEALPADLAALDELRAGPHYVAGAEFLPRLLLPAGARAAASRPVTRSDIFPWGAAFVLHHFLSDAECTAIIAQAERAGLRPVDTKVRQCSKASMWGWELASELFARAALHLSAVAVREEGSRDADADPRLKGITATEPGIYVPYGCNPTFRVCRYVEGGHFSPHRDGGHDIRLFDNFSIKTLMVYLNDDFEGGATTFYSDAQPCYQPGRQEHRTHAFRPCRGDCLVFNSHIVHDGGALTAGTKYILRSEVMFRRDDGRPHS